jgi:hypothetical protein
MALSVRHELYLHQGYMMQLTLIQSAMKKHITHVAVAETKLKRKVGYGEEREQRVKKISRMMNEMNIDDLL